MFAIGAMLNNLEPDRLQAWRVAKELGFGVVHASALPEDWLPSTPELAQYIATAQASGLTVHSMFVGFAGQSYADPATAAATVGLAVTSWRAHRLQVALRYPPVAEQLGAPCLATHLGRLPAHATADYADLVAVTQTLADACAARHQRLHFETGQEPAADLVRFLVDLERNNVGVNFDPANFVLYGSDEPLSAVELLGPWVGGVHCKDALAPVVAGQLGADVPLGQGVVPWPPLVRRLLDFDYRGPWIIERERGPQVRNDFLTARVYLEQLFGRAFAR
jgi:sugar phosphate isomerase/epimerase